MKVYSIIIMGMLLGFDSYTKCVLILYRLLCSVLRTCIFPLFFVVQNLITTIGCEFCIPIPSMMCVSVPFSKLHEHACFICFHGRLCTTLANMTK